MTSFFIDSDVVDGHVVSFLMPDPLVVGKSWILLVTNVTPSSL